MPKLSYVRKYLQPGMVVQYNHYRTLQSLRVKILEVYPNGRELRDRDGDKTVFFGKDFSTNDECYAKLIPDRELTVMTMPDGSIPEPWLNELGKRVKWKWEVNYADDYKTQGWGRLVGHKLVEPDREELRNDRVCVNQLGTWHVSSYELASEAQKKQVAPLNKKNLSSPIMSNIFNFIKNLGLSKEDKLMLELGLEDPTGTPTVDGLHALALIMYAENRQKLVDKAIAMKAEQDAAKK